MALNFLPYINHYCTQSYVFQLVTLLCQLSNLGHKKTNIFIVSDLHSGRIPIL